MGTGRRVAIIVLNLVLFWGVLPVALVWVGWLVDAWLGLPVPGFFLRAVGGAAATTGLAFSLWAVVVLRVRGKGLPISSLPPPEFVPNGPYGWVRHPIYTGYVFLAGGGGLAAGSWGIGGVVVPVVALAWFATWVRLYEEPGLLRRFGNAYRIYAERTPGFLPFRPAGVGRWLVLLMFRLLFRISVEGGRNVHGRGPVLIYSDHLCYLDFVFAQYATRRPMRIPVTAEVFRKPLQRAFMRMMGGVPTRRFCADPASLLSLADELSAGGVVGIAVEGERSWTGEMSLPTDNVVRNMLELSQAGVAVVPLAFAGSYRVWPRWANGADRRAKVVIRIGKPFDLRSQGALARLEGESLVTASGRVLRERVVALRLPDALLADPGKVPGARPELALWRCPICEGEETLSLESARWLTCAGCNARWDSSGGDLTVVQPEERAGEKGTLAGWCHRAGCVPGDLHISPLAIDRSILQASQSLQTSVSGPATILLRPSYSAEASKDKSGYEGQVDHAPSHRALAEPCRPSTILAAECELREDPEARLTLQVLKSLGMGMATLCSDSLDWKREGARRRIALGDIRTVTTERNDTLQLGVGRGVVQLVFPKASPWRWQSYVMELRAGHANETDCGRGSGPMPGID